MEIQKKIPTRVFIVPYRNRVQHKFFFCKYMTFLLEDLFDYEILFVHQFDKRSFNRGAMKNIGFLAVKHKYPNDYKNITLIFNDVDTMPFNKIFEYETSPGVIQHYYGFTYTLGGIVVIKAADFEKINGFPNFWGYGMEDNCLQTRSEKCDLTIDRSHFYSIGSPEILQLFDGVTRIINKKDPWRMKYDDGVDGIRTIHNLYYTIDKESKNENDNISNVEMPNLYVINVTNFLTKYNFESDDYYHYDLREPSRKIIHPDKVKKVDKGLILAENWKNIPTYEAQPKQNLGTEVINTAQQQQQIQHPHPHPHPQNREQINYNCNYSPVTIKNITSKKYRTIKMGGMGGIS
jgi:hypothetical protein